jgi:hypothetical protein
MNVSEHAVQNDQLLNYAKALEYCNKHIEWYEKHKARQRIAFQLSQIAIVLLSGITPVLILVGDLPPVVQALPPALVTMIVGLSGIFQWKENYQICTHSSST